MVRRAKLPSECRSYVTDREAYGIMDGILWTPSRRRARKRRKLREAVETVGSVSSRVAYFGRRVF